MSHSRAKRLQPLIDIAQKSAQEALGYIGNIQQRIEAEKQKKETLLQYQLDYRKNFNKQGRTGVTGLQIQGFESFILQIEQALTQQELQKQHLEQQLKEAQKIYQNLNMRLKSYEKLQSRLNEQAQMQENKQMQKFLDEIGAQLHRLHHDSN